MAHARYQALVLNVYVLIAAQWVSRKLVWRSLLKLSPPYQTDHACQLYGGDGVRGQVARAHCRRVRRCLHRAHHTWLFSLRARHLWCVSPTPAPVRRWQKSSLRRVEQCSL